MKKAFTQLINLAAGLLISASFYGQGVRFDDKIHLSLGDRIQAVVSAPFDTITQASEAISYALFANSQLYPGKPKFTTRDTMGWFQLPLIKEDVKASPGIHTLFIQFPDSFVRVFNILVNDKIANTVSNLFEKERVFVEPEFFDQLINTVEQKLAQTDSLLMARMLPEGLKAAVCIDIWNPARSVDGDKLVCTECQYLFYLPNGIDDKTVAGFFRELTGSTAASPLDIFLNLPWQFTTGPFDKDHPPGAGEIFSNEDKYAPLKHANKVINQKLHVGYIKQKTFKRILIYIDS